MEVELYKYLDWLDFSDGQEWGHGSLCTCAFCGRLSACYDVFGNMFCLDIPTCTMVHLINAGRYRLDIDLSSDYKWTIDLLKKCNVSRLPTAWKEWAIRQLENSKKGDM